VSRIMALGLDRQQPLSRRRFQLPHQVMRSNRLLVWFTGLALGMMMASHAAAQFPSDAHALSVLFDEQHVEGSALYVRSRITKLSAEERYEYLTRWVLPGETHQDFRLGLAFVPTDPSPPVLQQYNLGAEDDAGQVIGDTVNGRGGYPISPAFDLIAVATRLGKLGEIRSRINTAAVEGEFQERCRLALLILTDIARKDYQPAIGHLDDLAARLREEAFEEYPKRWPETLAAWAGIQPPETRQAASELLFGMLHNQVRTGYARGPDAWDRGVAALGGLLAHHESLGKQAVQESLVSSLSFELEHFSPLSRTTALTRGYGFPVTRWISASGHIEKIAGHNEDYLMYHSPLRGDFELECDVSHFGWSDCHPCVAGVWAAATQNQSTLAIGEFRSARPPEQLVPEMSLFDESIHYRVVVRDGNCTTYLNGRPVHEEALPRDHDPWISIRSPWNANSVVHGLRMSGSPEIPEQVRLSVLPDLTGWTAYYDESVGRTGSHWSHYVDRMGVGSIVGRRQDVPVAAAQESLLRYQRPMFEDGTIEYDFFYGSGRFHVHPSLDRRAFLLTPEGVRLHWITDGVYDLTGLDPANSMVEPGCRQGPDQLPLIPEAWNHLKLSVNGDQVELTLNGKLVYRCKLEPTNRRTFGLFHYSDRTEARVRNVVWSGDWPHKLPPVADQKHADHRLDFLDEDLAKLEATCEYDFTQAEFPFREFIVRGEEWEKHVTAAPEGLLVETAAFEEFRPTYVSPKVIVEGDFDIIAEFRDLRADVASNGASGISLRTILEDELEQRTVYRGLVQHPPAPQRQLMESILVQNDNQKPKMTYRGVTSQEAPSGRLRLARRGETVYSLFSEGDSSVFRLVSKVPCPAGRLRLEGVRLMTVTQGKTGSTSVVWKHLIIRADKIIRK